MVSKVITWIKRETRMILGRGDERKGTQKSWKERVKLSKRRENGKRKGKVKVKDGMDERRD